MELLGVTKITGFTIILPRSFPSEYDKFDWHEADLFVELILLCYIVLKWINL